MASFKMMSSSNSRNSDLSRRNSSSASSSPSVRSNHLRRDPHPDHSRISFGYGGGNDVTIHDYAFASDSTATDVDRSNGDRNSVNGGRKSVDDVWKETASGEKKTIMKEEAQECKMQTRYDPSPPPNAANPSSSFPPPPTATNLLPPHYLLIQPRRIGCVSIPKLSAESSSLQ